MADKAEGVVYKGGKKSCTGVGLTREGAQRAQERVRLCARK